MRGTEVFVGGLPPTVTERALLEIFSQCGEIQEIRLIKDRDGNVKGFCFVRFVATEAAERAVKEKDGLVLDGRKIGVLPSTEQYTLYIGNLNKGWSANEFEGIVHQVFPDVVSVDLATFSGEDQSGTNKNRGFAFVKFSSHAAASRALRVGSQPDFIIGNLHPAVKWAEEQQPEITPEVLSQVKVAFIRNLPANADDNFLKKLFQPFGEIEKVVLWKKGISPVGFVHFTKRSDLENAITAMHEKVVEWPRGGPTHKLSVEIARPSVKSKKRGREDSGSNIAKKIPNNLENSSRRKSEGFSFSGLASGAQKEQEYEDPYEAAVMSLPVSVKERLLRILRLQIATRFDINIQILIGLKQLSEPAAIAVLDQFMLSGADANKKGVYLAGLISRHQVDRLKVGRSGSDLSRAGDFARSSAVGSSFSDRVSYVPDRSFSPPMGPASYSSRLQLPAVYSLSSDRHLSDPGLDTYVPRLSAVISDTNYSIFSRVPLGRTEETSGYPLHPASASYSPFSPQMDGVPGVSETYASLKHSSAEGQLIRPRGTYVGMFDGPSTRPPVSFSDVSSHLPTRDPSRLEAVYTRPLSHPQMIPEDEPNLLPTQPRVRFDPYTGEPYKFDPYTGERLLPDTSPRGRF